MIINEIRQNRRFDKMLTQIHTAISKNEKAKTAITSINQLDQPLAANAIVEHIPSILSNLEPKLQAMHDHRKALADARKAKNKSTAKTASSPKAK